MLYGIFIIRFVCREFLNEVSLVARNIMVDDTMENVYLQICEGKVTAVALYQGAFVDIGGVHDG